MRTDLDDRIRTALRERTAEVLPVRTELRSDRGQRRWVAPLLSAAAAIVVAVAVAVAVTVHRGSGSDTGGTAAGVPAYAGYQWRVASFQDRYGLLVVPAALDAIVGFRTDGSVYANDTVNYLSATYVPTATAYTVEHAGSTLAGYDGSDPARARVIAAVDALFFSGSSGTPGGAPRVTIVAAMRGDTLTLRTAGTEIMTVTLERAGAVSDAPTAPPSQTSSAPGGASSASDLPYRGTASPATTP